ncbi:MAG: hypothetical protein MUC97_14195 [Bernardetiaceae bacterium]|jgi:hypothetical protein|nr:hypothetical protein [Bernardetiaceae bacterium]
MNQRIAHFLSVALHPAIMPSYVFGVLFFGLPGLLPFGLNFRWLLLAVVFITTFVIPALSLLVSYRAGLVATLHLANRAERRYPFVSISLFYLLTCGYFLFKLQAVPWVGLVMLGITLAILFVTVITFFFKISAHATGASGLVGTLAGLQIQHPHGELLFWLPATILLAGALMTARLALNAHQPFEILAGALVGFGTCFGAMFLNIP